MAKKAILKLNGGLGAVLCSSCSVIIRSGNTLTDEDRLAIKRKIKLYAQYCKPCIIKLVKPFQS
jgi:hypothetical protein